MHLAQVPAQLTESLNHLKNLKSVLKKRNILAAIRI